MEVKKERKKVAIILVFLLALFITECSPKREIIREDEDNVLRTRVEEYWSCRIKGEWTRCYLYESPEYRAKAKVEAYVVQNARSVTKWEGYEITDLWTSDEEGHVKLNVNYRYLIPKIQGVWGGTIAERWEKKDGQWYRISEDVR